MLQNFTITASNSQQRTMQPDNVNLGCSDCACRARMAPMMFEPLTTGRDSERTMLQTDNATSCCTQLNALPHHKITASFTRQQCEAMQLPVGAAILVLVGIFAATMLHALLTLIHSHYRQQLHSRPCSTFFCHAKWIHS